VSACGGNLQRALGVCLPFDLGEVWLLSRRDRPAQRGWQL